MDNFGLPHVAVRLQFQRAVRGFLENYVFSDENRAKRPEIQATPEPSGPQTLLLRALNLPSQSLRGPVPAFPESLRLRICLRRAF